MDLNVLEQAMRRKRVRACVIMANCHNPLGYVLPDDTKSSLADLGKRYKAPIVEDDLFGDLAFQEPRPRTIKYYDREGLVLLVSSFFKVLGPGYRVGWVQAGRWQSIVEQLQFVNSMAAPSLPQQVIARFLQSGGYDRHLRRLRILLADRLQIAGRAIAQHFPPATRVTRPKGGFLLWLQLPKTVNAITVFEKSLKERVEVVPGSMYSTTGQFGNCLRVNCGSSLSRIEQSVAILGSIATSLAAGSRRA